MREVLVVVQFWDIFAMLDRHVWTIQIVKLEMCVTRAQNDVHLVMMVREMAMRLMLIVVENQLVVRRVRMVRNVIETKTAHPTCVFEGLVPRVSTVF